MVVYQEMTNRNMKFIILSAVGEITTKRNEYLSALDGHVGAVDPVGSESHRR